MGSIRGIKTKVRFEERAAEGRKCEIQDRQWEESYDSWQLSHDPNYSEHNGENRPCFGSHYSAQESLSPQCKICNVRQTCESAWIDFLVYCSSVHFDPGPHYGHLDYDCEQDRLWEEEREEWIEEQSEQSVDV